MYVHLRAEHFLLCRQLIWGLYLHPVVVLDHRFIFYNFCLRLRGPTRSFQCIERDSRFSSSQDIHTMLWLAHSRCQWKVHFRPKLPTRISSPTVQTISQCSYYSLIRAQLTRSRKLLRLASIMVAAKHLNRCATYPSPKSLAQKKRYVVRSQLLDE